MSLRSPERTVRAKHAIPTGWGGGRKEKQQKKSNLRLFIAWRKAVELKRCFSLRGVVISQDGAPGGRRSHAPQMGGGGGEARGRENSDGANREGPGPPRRHPPPPARCHRLSFPGGSPAAGTCPPAAPSPPPLPPRASSSPRRDGVTLTLLVEKPETGGRRRRPEPGLAERGRCLECGTRRARSPPRRRSSL